jgi:uncharacterized membrane protein YfcA
MDLATAALLAGTGVFAGLIATVVGGAAVVVYPVMIAAGVPPQPAVVGNMIALMPASLLAAVADHTQLPPFDRAFVGLVLTSIFGAAAGAVVLLFTPPDAFQKLVPLLLGLATVIFAYAERMGMWLRRRAQGRGHELSFNVSSLKVLLPVSFYGGYFGAGAGILLLGVFSLATGGDYRSANVTKNLVAALNGVAAACIFISQGAVLWPQTLALMFGTIGGGFLGSHIARMLPKRVIHVLVVVAGVALTISFAQRYWF